MTENLLEAQYDITKKSKLTSTSKKYTPFLITSIIGCLIGGPIGLLISNLFHMGLSISIITEILSVVGAITTGNLLRNSYCISKIQRQFKATHNTPPSETIILINQCFYNNKLELKFTYSNYSLVDFLSDCCIWGY